MSFENHPIAKATITLTPGTGAVSDVDLPISEGTITLDTTWSPYVQASVTVPLTSEELLEQIDPDQNEGQRVTVTASANGSWVDGEWVPSDERDFDLVLRSREVSHDGKTLRLELESDERVLQNFAPLTDDKTPRDHEASLRDIVKWTLCTVGLGNLHPNPSMTENVDGYAPSGSGITVSWRSNGGMENGPCGNATVSTTSTVAVYGPTIPVRAGQTITVSHYVRTSPGNDATGRQVRSRITWLDGGGGSVSAPSLSLTTEWERTAVTAVVPAGVTQMRPDVLVNSHASITGAVFWDWAQVEYGAEATPYRDSALEPGSTDADLTARWSLQNSILNPDGISTGAAYTNAGSSTVTYNSTAGAGVGGTTGYVVGTSTASSGTYNFIGIPQNVSTRKGDIWTLSLYAHRANANPALNGVLRVYEWDNLNGTILKQHESTPKVIPASGASAPYTWERFDFTFTVANPNTTTLSMYFGYAAAASGRTVAIDHVMLTPGPVLVDYFSGAVTPAGYTTNWTGSTPTANNSVSERAPSDGVERLPELFTWEAGVSAWDFLTPLLYAAGYRLYCDEQRHWHLVDPVNFTQPGRFTAIPSNTVEGSDLIDTEAKLRVDGVVVTYVWTDADGITHTRKDTAGSPGRVYTETVEREYPGPGRAAAILAKRSGLGRTQDVRVATDFRVQPGQELAISLPATAYQLGQLTRVDFGLSSGLMQLGSSGLRETPDGAIDLLPGTIDGLSGSIDSLT